MSIDIDAIEKVFNRRRKYEGLKSAALFAGRKFLDLIARVRELEAENARLRREYDQRFDDVIERDKIIAELHRDHEAMDVLRTRPDEFVSLECAKNVEGYSGYAWFMGYVMASDPADAILAWAAKHKQETPE